MKNISQIDYARLAAYIDGEGCIQIHCVKQYSRKAKAHWRPHYITQVVITNTDPRLIVWLKETFGGFITRYSTGKRPCFKWHVHSQTCSEMLLNCLPYFLVKKRQAEIAIAFRKTYSRDYIGRGRSVPDSQIAKRDALIQELSDDRRKVRDEVIQ